MIKSWIKINLGEACTKIGSGATPRGGNSVYSESGSYSLIRSQNIYNDGFHRDGLAFITETHAKELNNVEVQRDDILLNITGDSVARCCQVDQSILPARVNQHVAIIRPDPDKLNPRFLRYVLVSPEIQALLLSWAGSGGTRNALTKGMIESLNILAPKDLEEQRAIAHILGTLDDKIELNRRMNETLEAMARAIFKSWFVDFDPVRAKAEGRDTGLPEEIADLFPDSFEETELGEVPKGWKIGTLGDIATVIDCLHSKKPERTESGKPLLQLGNIRDDGLIDMEDTYFISENDYEKWISRIEASFGDCVITNVGRVGAVAQIPEDVKAALGRNMTAIRCNSQYQYPTYLIELLVSDYMKGEISLKTDNGTVMSALNVKNIPKLSLVLPPKKILQAFESTASTFRRKMEANHQQSLLLKTLRNSLLPKLMSGEIRGITDSTKY